MVKKGRMHMAVDQRKGDQSLAFLDPVHIISSASIVGPKEGEGPLGDFFDLISQDAGFGEKNWEKAESTLQKEALTVAAGKAKLSPWQIRYLFGGDLLAQLSATSFGTEESNLPFFGLYGACSTCGESLTLAAMAVAGGFADYAAAITSSHFGSAEKEFRFPPGLWESASPFSYLDGHRKRSLYTCLPGGICKNYRGYAGENCRYGSEG